MSMSSVGRVVARVALVVAILAALAIVLAGPGNRFGVWDFRFALRGMSYGAYAALAGAALGLLGVVLGGARGMAAAALVIGLGAFAGPYSLRRIARAVPPIHDITTDTADPPKFVAVMPRRAASKSNPADYAGEAIAAQQRAAYPDVQPLRLAAPPPQAFDRALRAARDMGWEIVEAAPDQGRIEATATTPWFGFKDDVVVRVKPETDGSRVDVRSLSRVGRSDLGANAKRIRRYLDRLRRNG
jgi:uncharacterized protein (DUF1499 family)